MPQYQDPAVADALRFLRGRLESLQREVDVLRSNQGNPVLARGDHANVPAPYEGQMMVDYLTDRVWYYSRQEWRPLGGGRGIYAIELFEVEIPVLVGDNKFRWEIPFDLDGAQLVHLDAYVTTPSSSGSVQVQFRKFSSDGTVDSGDVLSTVLTIEAGNYNSRESATPYVINTGNDEVSYGDHYRVDIDAAGVGATGLGVVLYFEPAAAVTLAVQGATGPAGGITAWRSSWQTATSYAVGDVVSSGGTTYVATTAHTSGATTEPGVGVDWMDDWMVLVQGHQFSSLAYVIDGSGYILDTGLKGPGIIVPYDATIVEASLLADFVGSVVVDIWKDDYGNYPPTDADSITGSTPLTLASASKTTDTVLTGWTTSISAGDVLRFNIDSIIAIRSLTVELKLERT